MKKRISQILLILIILMISVFLMTNISRASWAIENPEQFNPSGEVSMSTEASETTSRLLGALQVIGSIVSVAVLIIIGIKYMVGSASEKADYKKAMIPYLIGAVLLFSGTTLPSVIYGLVTGM